MVTAGRTAFAAACGGVFGSVSGIIVVKISVLSLDNATAFDQWFSGYWSNILALILVPGAFLSCAVFFAFLYFTGLFRISTFAGIVGGALFGFFFGPPESMLPEFNVAQAIVLLLWEWLFGGIGGIVGSMIGRTVERYD
jgi:hypothetical protein